MNPSDFEAESIPDQGVWCPDGLTGDDIDALLVEMEEHGSTSARPTLALLDGSAALRRERRMTRRAIGAVVRALPTRPQLTAPEGEVA
jgi:hypothetical protein